MDRYGHLFDVSQYEDEACVVFYRSKDGGPVGETHSVPESIFARLRFIGFAYGLHYISMFELYSDVEFNKMQIGTLIDELNVVLSIVDDPVLRHFVSPVLQISLEIVRHHGNDTLVVSGN